MIELLDTIYIPHIGGYDVGDQADLGEALEAQLVSAGKAKKIADPDLLTEKPWPAELAGIHKAQGFAYDPEKLKRQIEKSEPADVIVPPPPPFEPVTE